MENRLTIGCRTRIITIKEKPKQEGSGHASNEDFWRRQYGGREVLLKERSHRSFSVMLIGNGVKELKKEDPNTITSEMAWVPEEDMELVNRDFDTNLDFMDWYQDNERRQGND